MLEITFFGVRGSYPLARPDHMYYGGNTSCLLARTHNASIICDGGTGIACLSASKYLSLFRNRVDIFLTHTMWDHIMGLPFFRPLYQRLTQVNFYGARQYGVDLKTILHEQQESVYCAQSMKDLPSLQQFHTISEQSILQIGDVEITPVRLNHGGTTLGFIMRDSDDCSVAYLTDTAPFEEFAFGEDMTISGLVMVYQELVEKVRGCSALIYDTHFTPEDMETYRKWGHSSYIDALKLADDADVGTICMFHHAPHYSDKVVDRHLHDAKKTTSRTVVAAIEGWTLRIENGDVTYEN